MSTHTQSNPVQQLSLYAVAAATCADRYAKAFYPMIKDADEKMVCCVHGAEDMDHYITAAEVLRGLGVDLGGLVERSISERGLPGADVLETTASWAERAAFSAIFERALLAQLRELASSDCAPIARMAGAAIVREERHVAHGLELLRTACGDADGKAQAQDAVRRIWPVALAVLDTGELRQAFADATRDELGALGLSVSE
ncbi:Phenylacetic acid catabolic protein [Sorangium sp. So ce1182]|uniref:Phenylacetic acid catabolic protein n=1 Tax=Sorangium sp. So ce1182 TaxID=3133334 RepID=UPI003F5E157E